MLQVVPVCLGPTEAIAVPLGNSTLPTDLPKGPLAPCHIAGLSLPAEAFKWVNLKDSSKAYMCRECDRIFSNWNSMVSHYLHEHLRVCLVYPKCGISYSDPSNFQLHGREIHTLLFY